jgi:hypothetical protein
MFKFMRVVVFSVLVVGSVAACTPEEVALYHTMNTVEQEAVRQHLVASNKPVHSPPGGFLACVRNRESGNNYSAKNPSSTASGAYQFLDSSWRNLSARAGHRGYATARSAPPHVQDAVAIWTLENIGRSPWHYPPKPC